MTERDELSALIHSTSDTFPDSDAGVIAAWSDELADAALAAGYRRPRVIETADELDSLPAGAVVLDGEGVSWQKYRSPRTGKTWWGANNYDLPTSLLVERLGPVTVLWEGGE